MLPWAALLGTLGLNYLRHRLGRSTLCSTARRWVPPWLFFTLWGALSAWLACHYVHARPLDRLIRAMTR